MKKLRLFVLGGIFAATMPLAAKTETVGGYTWTYRINGGAAEIYKDSLSAAISPNPTGAVTIPSTLGGKPVTRIGNYAFSYCSGLTSVTIPPSVTSIGHQAFCDCSGLTSVTIPNSVTSIEVAAFSDCSGLTSVTIPESVTSIGDMVFCRCIGLTSVTIPESVTSIGNDAFEDCTNLTNVTIPDSVTSIGEHAFWGCVAMADEDGFVIVRNVLYYYCGSAANLTIPDGVTSIGMSAFYDCSGLTSVTIPDSVTRIEDCAFYDCSGLKSVTIGNGVTSIGGAAFRGCSGLASVMISASVTNIEDDAFRDCSGLASVTIPASVTHIGEDAFNGCNSWATVHVMRGDADRVRRLIKASGYNTDNLAFVECDGDSVTPEDEVLDAKDITAPYEAPKAMTLMGAVYDGDAVVGIVELKLSKVNAKKKTGKVSGSVTTLDGNKHAIAAFNLKGIDGTSPQIVALKVKDLGTMNVTIGGKQFAGSLGDRHVQSAKVGGKWAGKAASVSVAVGDVSKFSGTMLRELLPDVESASVKNGKWAFAKSAGVKWAKPKRGASRSEYYDEASGKDLIVDTAKGKTNLSGLKLTYTPKAGTFKGSFKVYALQGTGTSRRLKSYTVNVTGVVVNGVGYGTAMCKKPAAGPWPVTVE